MAELGKQRRSTIGLLGLPDAIISKIITALTESDRMNFMAACRATFQLTLPAAAITLRITEDTKFSGISKVLDSFPAKLQLEIICPPDLVEDALPSNSSQWPAVALMIASCNHLGPAPSNHCWNMITKITIQATQYYSLKSLVPQFIAVACPQLAQLAFMQSEDDIGNDDPFNIFTSTEEDSISLTPCRSLKQLEIDFGLSDLQLPPAYHSPAELRHNLPNIDSLLLKGCYNDTLVEAFAAQLTQLQCWSETDDELQSLHLCSNLQHLHMNTVFLPDNAAALRVVDLSTHNCSDDDISELLQLPSLTTLRVLCVGGIQEDWSGRACPWQELHLGFLPDFTILGNLCLSSLKKLSVEDDMEIRLPNPDDPSSLAAVRRAADNLAHVGHIVLGGRDPKQDTSFGKSGSIYWHVPDCDDEQAPAELIRVASQRIAPVRVCNCQNLARRPLVLDAVLNWGRDFLESVCLGSKYESPPLPWQALCQLPKLTTVAFWPQKQQLGQQPETGFGILQVITDAAMFVISANRSLRIEFGVSLMDGEAYSEEELQRLKTGWCQIMKNVVGIMMPAGSKVVGVDYSRMLYDNRFTYYGSHGCSTNKFWVVDIEPSQCIALEDLYI